MTDTPATQIPAELLQVYRETDYRVFSGQPFILHIDQASAELAALHRARGVACSAFITACNPRSQELSDAENAARQQALAGELRQRGLDVLPALGQHPQCGWQGEPSFLVPGLELEAAKTLGTACGQNAILWSGADAVPGLVLLR